MSDSWSPSAITTLRERLNLSRAEMGAILYGYDGQMARKSLYRLEHGKTSASGAVQQTLDRLEAGRLDPQTELQNV